VKLDTLWRQLIIAGLNDPPHGDWVVSRDAFDGVSIADFTSADIAEVAWLVLGEDDGPPSVALFRLADGRWVYFAYLVNITGYIYFTYVFAADRGRLWWWACTDDDRERLSAQFSPDEHADEMVQLDIMLQSEDPRLRELGEKRMTRIRTRGR
jgi:hypothetical protein